MVPGKRSIVTGHAVGIGKAIVEMLSRKGWTVSGASRASGFDLESLADRKRLIEDSLSCDLFVNNAQAGFHQTELLFELHSDWLKRGHRATIINICSMTVHDHRLLHSSPMLYDFQKKSLRDLSMSLAWDSPIRVMCVSPGYVATPRVLANPKVAHEPKLDPKEVAQAVEWLVDLPSHILIPDLSIKAMRESKKELTS